MTKDEFLNQIVFGWIKEDLENISRIRTVIPGEGNANLPLAMCIVIYMDHLGSYLLGTYAGLETNIRAFLTCFKNPLGYPPELLNDLFRNGLAHDYFARGGISRDGTRPPMINVSGKGVILDADTLLVDFFESLDVFKTKLTEENFEKRFTEAKGIMEKRYETHQAIIDKLPKPPDPVISSFAAAAGASGTAVYSKDIHKLQND